MGRGELVPLLLQREAMWKKSAQSSKDQIPQRVELWIFIRLWRLFRSSQPLLTSVLPGVHLLHFLSHKHVCHLQHHDFLR